MYNQMARWNFTLALLAVLALAGCAWRARGSFSDAAPSRDAARGALRLPALFGDHCVLQCGREIPVWGWDTPGQRVTVTLAGVSREAVADRAGRWRVALPPLPAGGPHDLIVEGSQTLIARNALIGEVWLCSGQSNIVFPLEESEGGLEASLAPPDPGLRVFVAGGLGAVEPVEDLRGEWRALDRETAGGVSAIAYYFGAELRARRGAPVGLIQSAWAGSRIEAWMPAAALRADPRSELYLERYREDISPARMAEKRRRFVREITRWTRRELRRPAWPTGLSAGWARPEYDDSDWQFLRVPGHWEYQEWSLDGAVWYRRRVEIPAGWAGRPLTLSLGGADDFDTTWFNGAPVGGVGPEALSPWMVRRRYAIPPGLARAGENTIAVRVTDYTGGGGLHGAKDQFCLGPSDLPTSSAIPLAGEWRAAVEGWYPMGGSAPPPAAPEQPANAKDLPAFLYNGMIAPLAPYAIRGVLWYQGESNAVEAGAYAGLLARLAESWRAAWGQGEFPFLYAQLPAFGGAYQPRRAIGASLREAQLDALGQIPAAAMIPLLDLGDCADIHPRRKREAGERFARAARALAYGEAIEYSGPVLRGWRAEDGRMILEFDHTAGALRSLPPGAPPAGFWISGEDRVFRPAKAKIEGESVIVWREEIESPAAARYAWSDCPAPSLFNAAGLPAPSFRTDRWPDAVLLPPPTAGE